MSDHQQVLRKVSDLIKLSQSDNEEEARTAAMQATRLMSEYKLVIVPQSELERIQKVIGESQALARKAESEKQKQMLVGLGIGVLVGKQGLL